VGNGVVSRSRGKRKIAGRPIDGRKTWAGSEGGAWKLTECKCRLSDGKGKKEIQGVRGGAQMLLRAFGKGTM